MERFSSRTVDELGRLVLHSEIRQRLGLEMGSKVSLTLVGTIVVMQRAEDDSDCETHIVDDLGRVVLPAELRKTLDWKEEHKVSFFHTDNLIILKSA